VECGKRDRKTIKKKEEYERGGGAGGKEERRDDDREVLQLKRDEKDSLLGKNETKAGI
jgi:hypothetical protein